MCVFVMGWTWVQTQVWVGVIPVGPSGQALNSSFKTRNDAAYKRDLGSALAKWASIVPDGLLVFFPSYAVLKSCIDFWKSGASDSSGGVLNFQGTLWDRITQSKQAVIEPKVRSRGRSHRQAHSIPSRVPSKAAQRFMCLPHVSVAASNALLACWTPDKLAGSGKLGFPSCRKGLQRQG
jgi:regulator of telomere elongation helicase 1